MRKGPKPRSIEERFWPKVDKRGPGECWPWRAATTHYGYGKILGPWAPKEIVLATHVAWFLATGVRPHLFVLHRCDNPPCVNPAHLFLGTQKDNMRDRDAKGRQPKGDRAGLRKHPEAVRRGEMSTAAKLTAAQVLAILADARHYAEVARDYGISKGHIFKLRAKKRWRHLHAPLQIDQK